MNQLMTYEIHEWSVFEMAVSENRTDSTRVPVAAFKEIEYTKQVIRAYLYHLDFEDCFENHYDYHILFETKAAILERMQDFFGIEVRYASGGNYVGTAWNVEDVNRIDFLEHLLVRFLDESYHYFCLSMTDYDYCIDGTIYGYAKVEELPLEHCPILIDLPLPVQVSPEDLFTKHLTERIEFASRSASHAKTQSKFEFTLVEQRFSSQYELLLEIQHAWNELKFSSQSIQSFVSQLEALRNHPQFQEDDGNWFVHLRLQNLLGIIDWALSYFKTF